MNDFEKFHASLWFIYHVCHNLFLISSVPHSFMLMEKICLIISNKSWMIPKSLLAK